MEYVYSAMLLHSAGKAVDEKSVTAVLEAAGASPDASRVKALVASLKDVKIDEAIKEAAAAPVAVAAPAAQAAGGAEAKEERSEEDEKKSEEEAAAGLGSLFG
ncbi:MAG: 50S ribosomal protein P1 [Candidatus Diapherotrites archaeon]|nr:50S ribosomal protein P1 [Candidatus Micrarchaeota archaeon]MBU1939294.1 50S ribosomal protein P1 [Candidatus Micrarchaeota archaeon]